ncbi:TnsD family Tn7-like transposition protein, partial [Neobacillus drentensis]|uniref:TnsD family Tn7-like transposition protein n=1 Tax=Neobacillus drentensis TaxID=220684 RepID=UPI002FFE130D
INYSLYKWLLRNDKEWLVKNYPIINEYKRKKYEFTNWKERDEELLIESKEIVRGWKRLETIRPKKITKHLISMQLRNSSVLYKYSEKLPLSINYVNSVIETSEQFNWRKLEWAYESFVENGETLTKTKLLAKAAVSQHLNPTKFVEEFLVSKL